MRRAAAQDQSGDYGGLSTTGQVIVDLDPKSSDGWWLLGRARYKLDDLDGAITAFGTILNRGDHRAPIFNQLGICFYRMSRYEDAATMFHQATGSDPNMTKAHFNLGNAFFDLERFNDAYESYRQATLLDPDHAQAWYASAECCLSLGDREQAMNCAMMLSNIDEDKANELLTRILPGQPGSFTL